MLELKNVTKKVGNAEHIRDVSIALRPGSLTSRTRQVGPSGGSDLRKSEMDANS